MLTILGGLLTATIILSVKTGLILGTSWLGRRGLLLVSFLFGTVLYGLILVFNVYRQALVAFLDRYTFAGALLAAAFFIYLGLQEAGEQRAGRGVYPSCTPGGYLFPFRGLSRLKYALGFLPCPLCLAALALSVILAGSMLGTGLLRLGLYVAVLFCVLVLSSSILVRRVIILRNLNPEAFFNPLLLFTGLATLISALFIPNFVQAMAMPMAAIKIESPRWLAAVLAGLVVLSLAGYFRYQINFLKERDD
ncbi:DUF2162 domain-containing protein [Desulfofundulus thermocisternus]|jgi:predicted transporter|uniref:DUF2162 domain-containing protein n=1 Tax=Desulfofundulus thermocisternus TaxID=42471 RepID=UPI00048A340F|nr:DUF2162 domain-containing protein [Desulfofundulus thermocisternus]